VANAGRAEAAPSFHIDVGRGSGMVPRAGKEVLDGCASLSSFGDRLADCPHGLCEFCADGRRAGYERAAGHRPRRLRPGNGASGGSHCRSPDEWRTVNSVDPAQHKVNLSHNPIPEIGWPAMTMDFPVAPSVDLRPLKPGARVNFTIEQGQGGTYEIKTISPVGGGR
jgi:Cu/Ag efflux protein CusF